MKKFLAFLLVAVMAFSLVACNGNGDNTETTTVPATEAQKVDYVLSDDVPEGSIVDGVMTDLSAADDVLTKDTASWLDTCVLYEVNVRQYTEEGTFKAFEGHLDRLKAMGVNTLWFMPIHPISETEKKGTLGSYYAVDDYTAVNPEFGTKEDFIHLVDTAHDMGFKVILDWVANHTGWDHKWVTEHKDWYECDDDGEIIFSYDWSDTAELNYENYEMRAEMIKAMQYWVEEIGIDGFRCDHAQGVPTTFWNAAVYKLKSINSEIMMLAECAASEALTTYAFDCCYNDDLYNQSRMILGGIFVAPLQKSMELSTRYAQGSFPMNYTDNHDKNSWEGTYYDRFGTSYEPLFALSFLTPGFPLVYTGNEQGYNHEIEFFEKDPVKWESELKYEELITELATLKTTNKALLTSNREVNFIETSDPHFLVFTRENGGEKVIYAANLMYEAVSDVTFELGIDGAKCVIHYDGTNFDFEDKDMSFSELEGKTYNPYEFYIFTVN